MNDKYTGSWTALVTPFTKSFGVDWEAFKNLLEFQMSQASTGVLPMGSTGESATVTHKEHSEIIAKTTEIINGRCRVLAGTGSNNTDEALHETGLAVEAGVDACLLVDCYYNKPSSIALRKEYYEPVLSKFPEMDFISYAIPGRSVTVISPEDLAILRHTNPNLVAVKDATGDFERMARTKSLVGEDFNIISGDDPNTFQMMSDKNIGASGVISVISNIAPASTEKLTRMLLEGRLDEAKKLDETLKPLYDIVGVKTVENVKLPNGQTTQVTYKHPNPVPVKTMMQALGMIEVGCKRPCGKLTKAGVEVVRSAITKVFTSNPEIIEPVGKHFDVDVGGRIGVDKFWENLSY
ncbi:MAG TPA: 4-hydroxy-tetrahydrodipicolinate synthase [Candidatus Altiarchaeales archaeon]|nr:4-hydroxy-tetrahydrodipicolinate synthase [Candidatus Altiarchaeales archaeon]